MTGQLAAERPPIPGGQGSSGIGALARTLAGLRRQQGPWVSRFPDRVRDLVLVSSSSRGGSSMLSEVLRRSDRLIHLRAEINPFLRLAGLCHPDAGTGCDLLEAAHLAALDPASRLTLDSELAMDAGRPHDRVDDGQYLLDLAWRMLVQWPDLKLDPVGLVDAGREVLAGLRGERGWPPDRIGDARLVQLRLLERLRQLGHPVDPWFYDLPAELARTVVPGPPAGPPGRWLVEEPPFVLTEGWRRASESDLETKPLVIKTPSNAYRMGFLRALFPNARIHVLHLTRNPGAAVNGLVDGWRHHGFHAHRMPRALGIAGYTDHRPEDARWWKFDLPPGWATAAEAPLARVCAFQWRTSHQAILAGSTGRVDYHRLRFEDLPAGPDRRVATLAKVAAWLDIPMEGDLATAASRGVAPVAATAPPAPGRWLARADLIRPHLDDDTLTVAKELGYGIPDRWT